MQRSSSGPLQLRDVVCLIICLLFRDLLSKDGEKLDIKINPDGTGQLHVPGLRIIEVKSFQHIKKVVQSSSQDFLSIPG